MNMQMQPQLRIDGTEVTIDNRLAPYRRVLLVFDDQLVEEQKRSNVHACRRHIYFLVGF